MQDNKLINEKESEMRKPVWTMGSAVKLTKVKAFWMRYISASLFCVAKERRLYVELCRILAIGGILFCKKRVIVLQCQTTLEEVLCHHQSCLLRNLQHTVNRGPALFNDPIREDDFREFVLHAEVEFFEGVAPHVRAFVAGAIA